MRLPIFALAVLALSCSSGFAPKNARKSITLTWKSGDRGTPQSRLPITFTTGPTFTYKIEVKNPDGAIDEAFDGWVRLSAKPGTVLPLQRNVRVVGGVADNVPITVAAAFGDTRIWAEDIGFTPSAPGAAAQCSNGVDDNDNYVRDLADPGCFSPDDDNEGTGSLAIGASDYIYFARPRVADVRGVVNGGTGTTFPHEQIRLDTGWDPQSGKFAFDVVVTGIASDGFYVTDVQDQNARGYASVFAFTFSSPQRLGVCDRLKILNGTALDFFGFTEMAFPTWSAELYNARNPARPCLVPEPRVFSATEVGDLNLLFRFQSGLVRLQSGGNTTVRISKHFGPDKVPRMGMKFVPQDNASSCDLDGSGRIDFGKPDEVACNDACAADVECSEYTNFRAQSNFNVVVASTAPTVTAKMQVNASASPSFRPTDNKGKAIGAFTGNLRYFSGGQQFTIEARCGDDLVLEPNGQPLPTDKACVRVRADLDLNEGR